MSGEGAEGGRPPTSGEGRAVRRALRWYLLWSLVVLVIVGVGVVLLSGVLVRSTTLRDAARTAKAIADTIVLPLATESFHDGNSSAVDAMTQALELRSRDGSLEHVRLWEEAGPGEAKILWADQPDIIVALDRETWAPIDVAVAVMYLSHWWFVGRHKTISD